MDIKAKEGWRPQRAHLGIAHAPVHNYILKFLFYTMYTEHSMAPYKLSNGILAGT